ncbi:MAG: hypothetical protein JNL95_06230 [Chitinophagales bacterium]|nr:hypothetical protein [Chitinophagales bacterium]
MEVQQILAFRGIILSMVSITTSILIAEIWYRYYSIRKKNESDLGLFYMAFALLIWGISEGLMLLLHNSKYIQLVTLAKPLFSTVNSYYLIIGLGYFEMTPQWLKYSNQNTKHLFLYSAITTFLFTVIFFLKGNYDYVSIPDFVYSICTVTLIVIVFFKTFISRGLYLLAVFSVIVMFMLLLAQPFLNFFYGQGKETECLILDFFSRLSFIIIICLLAYSWAQKKLLNVSDKLENLETNVSNLTREKDKLVKEEREIFWKGVAFTAAHKLGNPVEALSLNWVNVSEELEARNIKKVLLYLKDMKDSIHDMKQLLGDFKQLGWIENFEMKTVNIVPVLTKIERQLVRTDIEFTFNNNVQTQKPVFLKKEEDGVAVISRLDFTDEVFVDVDQLRFKMCFDELIQNSQHFFKADCEHKIITIDINDYKDDLTERNLKNNLKYVCIDYRDNGEGIPLERKESIFMPFETTYAQGTGLGLPTVRKIIELHGGIIYECGIHGDGAHFKLVLPKSISL